ncbi:leucine-rich repeat, cysteine-containing subtype protein [Tanacetum coccineum]
MAPTKVGEEVLDLVIPHIHNVEDRNSVSKCLLEFPVVPNIHSLSRMELPVTQYSSVLPLLNQIRKLKLVFVGLDEDSQCLLFKRCPNLEVLYTADVRGDKGLQLLGQFCKKLRKLANHSLVTHVGMIALAKGCTNLECLKVRLRDISNEALECLGTHLKNLRDFRIWLDISLRHGGLTDVGLEYIGKYGANLRSLGLEGVGNSNAGLVKLSEGCQKLRKLKLTGCPFSEQVVTSCVFNIPSLRHVRGFNTDYNVLALIRPEFQP